MCGESPTRRRTGAQRFRALQRRQEQRLLVSPLANPSLPNRLSLARRPGPTIDSPTAPRPIRAKSSVPRLRFIPHVRSSCRTCSSVTRLLSSLLSYSPAYVATARFADAECVSRSVTTACGPREIAGIRFGADPVAEASPGAGSAASAFDNGWLNPSGETCGREDRGGINFSP